MRYRQLIFLLPAIILFACQSSSGDSSPEAVLAKIIEADNKSDIETVLQQYSDDAILKLPGKPNISGRDSIRQNYETIFKNSELRIYQSADEVITSKDLAAIRGTIRGFVTTRSNKAITPVNDKFLMILKKTAEGWRINRLIWSRNE